MRKIIFLLAFALLGSCMALTSLQAAPHPHAMRRHANAPQSGRHTTNTHRRKNETVKREGRTHRRTRAKTHGRNRQLRKHADKLRIVEIKIDDVVVYRDRAFYKHGHEHGGRRHGMYRDGTRHDRHYEGARYGKYGGREHGTHSNKHAA